MSVSISKSPEEIRELPLVELACEILKAKKEPYYFRDLMNEIQKLRGLKDDEVMDVIARLYTEINVDGRFICIGQNVWGLKRWYPVDSKTTDRASTSKKFVRNTGDAFSDDDEELDDFDEELETEDDLPEGLDGADEEESDDEFAEATADEEEEEEYSDDDADEDADDELEELVEEDAEDEEEED